MHFVGNPMGAFMHKRSSKVRLVLDLSWPPKQSVKEYISKSECSLQYIKFGDIVKAVKLQGRYSNMAKLDIASAFKHIMVRQDQWNLLGFFCNVKVNMVNLVIL